jgi:nucleoside-diphosphate-sugar epimerase
VEVCRADLAQPATLTTACAGIDCIVHLAGVLFAPQPARFLPITNVQYVRNLLDAAQSAGVSKFILVSFPHVEGETTPENPASNRLDRTSEVVHFRTRLEAERVVLQAHGDVQPVVVRAGVVYGRDVKLIEAARWLLRHRLMAIWRRSTWIHLIALPDLLTGLQAAIEKEDASGIYSLCDDEPMLLQDFLDRLADHFGTPRPRRMPEWVFHFAGAACEFAAILFRTTAPLTRDIVRAGMTSSVSDNSRRSKLLPRLAYPTLNEGIALL